MARPLKTGLEYFSLDCKLDDNFTMIQNDFGLKGFAIVVKLYQLIYGERGYYCEWNKNNLLRFLSVNHLGSCDENLVGDIVASCIKRGIFSKEIYDRYRILTSRGIQKRYFAALSRRTVIEVRKDLLLVSVPKNAIIVDKNSKSVYENPENVCDNPQSKVKKSKYKAPEFLHTKTENLHTETHFDDGDDDGMDPMEAMRIWKEQSGK